MENYNVIWNRNCNCIISSLHQQANEECFLAKSKRKKAGYIMAGYIMISLILLVISSFYIFVKTVVITYIRDDVVIGLPLLLTLLCGLISGIMGDIAQSRFYKYSDILRNGGNKDTLQKLYEEECIRDFYECYNSGRVLSINFSDTRMVYSEDYTSSKKLIEYTYEDLTKTVCSNDLTIDSVQVKTNITTPTIHATDEAVVLQVPYKDENPNNKEVS